MLLRRKLICPSIKINLPKYKREIRAFTELLFWLVILVTTFLIDIIMMLMSWWCWAWHWQYCRFTKLSIIANWQLVIGNWSLVILKPGSHAVAALLCCCKSSAVLQFSLSVGNPLKAKKTFHGRPELKTKPKKLAENLTKSWKQSKKGWQKGQTLHNSWSPSHLTANTNYCGC